MDIRRKVVGVVGLSVFLVAVSLLKMSFVWVTKSYFFSGFCIFAPLLGAFVGVWGAGAVMLVAKVWRYAAWGTILPLTTGIPTMLAAWCWSLEGRESRGWLGASFGVNVGSVLR